MKRQIIAIDAKGVADFRRQLDAQIAEAQWVGNTPVLPPEGVASEEALIQALADAIEAQCVTVVELPATKKAA